MYVSGNTDHMIASCDVLIRNFGTKLAVWDWIFGTAHLPRPRKPSGYGLGDPGFPQGYVAQHLHAFRRVEEETSA